MTDGILGAWTRAAIHRLRLTLMRRRIRRILTESRAMRDRNVYPGWGWYEARLEALLDGGEA